MKHPVLKVSGRGAAAIALALTITACGTPLDAPFASPARSVVPVALNLDDFLRSNGATFEKRQPQPQPTISADVAARKAEAQGSGAAASEEYGLLTWAESRLNKRAVWLVTLRTQSNSVGYVFVDAADGRVLWAFGGGP